MLKVTGPEATMASQDNQICAGIDGMVHGVQSIWDENLTTEDWIFLLVDAKNAFNEINQIIILWTVQHLWPSGSRFVFNCYCHWSLLFFRNRNGTDILCTVGMECSKGNLWP